ncbi:TRAP transporter small permease [Bradyrhizobium zhanjiangense]|uniref:TRAP transporter small permease protein n=1 Tax=Bradyrhizobium zhanjiangense TaxID=1325107 RepID=A0ABY0DQC3_9BRAD|nr:TRAP transporter small permease [Bradyrhizobium zhanjiangense]
MSAHGVDLGHSVVMTAARPGSTVGRINRAMILLNRTIVVLCSAALIVASTILSYSVAARYFFNAATYWQDEAAVFLLVGATFLSTAFVQAGRGHIGIEALTGYLSKRGNAIRMLVVDTASLLFCCFFAWKSWTLFHEAWVDGQVSGSTWAPPLWIPYSMMSLGMTLMTVQIALQLASRVDGWRSK